MSKKFLESTKPTSSQACCSDFATDNSHLPTVNSFRFDAEERALLDTIRHIFCQHSSEDYNGVPLALERSCRVWPVAKAQRVVMRIFELVRSIQQTRRAPFDFIGPGCTSCSKHICQDELELMLLLRCALHGHASRINEAAERIAGHESFQAVADAALDVAREVKEKSSITVVPAPSSRALH